MSNNLFNKEFINSFNVSLNGISNNDNSDIINEIVKSIKDNNENMMSKASDLLKCEYTLKSEYSIEKNENKPFIFNEAPKGLYYNWSSSVSENYVCYTYSPGTTFVINKLLDPNAKLEQTEVLIFNKYEINSEEKHPPFSKITLPNIVQGIRSSLIIEDNDSNPFVLLGTFSYPTPGTVTNSYLLKWYFVENRLDIILCIENENSIRKIIRHKNCNTDNIYLSTQNDSNSLIIPKLYKLKTDRVIHNHSIELKNYLKTYVLKTEDKQIYGSVWDFEIDNEENVFISIPQRNIDNTKLSGFNTRGRLYYNKINLFHGRNSVDLLELIGNDYYPAGFNDNAISTFQTQSNNTNRLIIYSLSDFFYQLIGIIPKINLILQDLNPTSITNLSDIQQFILKIRGLFNTLDIDGFKVLYLDKNDLYKNKNPEIYCLIGDPPINTIDKSVSDNGNNNAYNVYCWQSTFDKDNNKVYLGSLDISSSIYEGIISLIKIQYPILYNILENLPENIKILILDILIKNPTLPINFNDKKFYFDVIEIDKHNNVKTITTNGFKSSNPELSDDGVRTISVIKNKKGKFLSVGSTCYQKTNSAKIYTLKLNNECER
jgi:hypothetical protein